MRFEDAIRGRRVWLSGHTGFTGGWFVLWLKTLGCRVSGLALAPDTEPNLFTAARIADGIDSEIGDIRDFGTVRASIERARPEVIFHVAAQPLVSRSFAEPVETIATNVLGTAHVLEAARQVPGVKAAVCVTTDKVYADLNAGSGYREDDRLGGKDPYAASKVGAEMVAGCYAATLSARGNGCRIATARGGNIIGGGDWSQDRIVPDFVRALVSSRPLVLRRPEAVRPWQHVLALVHGYLALAARLLDDKSGDVSAYNFGPTEGEIVTVRELVGRLCSNWTSPALEFVEGSFPETQVLQVDSAKARRELGWRPPLSLDDTIGLTAAWYRDFYARPEAARDLTMAQIEDYRRRLG